MADDLKQRTVRGVAWIGAGQLYGQFLQLVVFGTLTRLMAETEFGLLVAVGAFTAFMEIFQELGLTLAVIQRKDVTEEQLSTVFAVTVGLGAAIAALMALVVAPLAVRCYGEPRLLTITALLGLPFLIGSAAQVPSALLRKRLAFSRVVGVGIVSATIGSAVGIWAAFQGFGVYALIIRSLTTGTLRTVGLCAVGGWVPTCMPRLRSALGLFRFGAFATASSLLGWLHNWADKILVGRYLGLSLLAYYHLAFRIMWLPMRKVTQHVTQVAFSAFSAVQDDKARVRRGFADMSKKLGLVSFPMLIGLFAVAPEAVKVFLGPKWDRDMAMLLIRIMAVPGCLVAVGESVWTIFRSQGRPDVQFKFDCVSTAVLIGAFIYGFRWGVVGVAASYGLARAVLSFPKCGLAFRLIGFKWRDYWAALRTPIFATLGMAAAVFGYRAYAHSFGATPWLLLFVAEITVGAIAYAGMIWLIDREVYYDAVRLAKLFIERRRGGTRPYLIREASVVWRAGRKRLRKVRQWYLSRRVRRILAAEGRPSTDRAEACFDELQNADWPRRYYPYDQMGTWQRAAERAGLLLEFEDLQQTGASVLEAGCGDGMLGPVLASYGHQVTLLDFDDWRDERAMDMPFVSADLCRPLPFDTGSFDVVCSFNAFEHLPDPTAALGEFERVCRPGGLIYLRFGPLYAAPWGMHTRDALLMPYPQFLFPEELVRTTVKEEGLYDLGDRRLDDLQPLNGWRLRDYEDLWQATECRIEHRELPKDYCGLGLIVRFPEAFRGRGLTLEDVTTAGIVIALRKPRSDPAGPAPREGEGQ